MGSVFLAEDLKLAGKQWAIKEMRTPKQDYVGMSEEASLLIQLQHPQLPRIVDFHFDNESGFIYLIMDYVEGLTLSEWFSHREKRVSSQQAVHFAIQLCDILHYLHQQSPAIVHRDLKPANLIVGSEEKLWLVDFGIARSYKQGQQSDTIQLGTMGFAAPEQFLGVQSDCRSDLYSLGAMMYYLLNEGRHYGPTETPSSNPDSLSKIIIKLLSDQPEDRFQTAIELKQALLSISPTKSIVTTSSKSTPDPCLIVIGSLYPGAGSTFTAIAIARALHSMQIEHCLIEYPTIEPDLYYLLYGDRYASKIWRNGHTQWVAIPPDEKPSEHSLKDVFALITRIKAPIKLVDISGKWNAPDIHELLLSADLVLLVTESGSPKISRHSSIATIQMLQSLANKGLNIHIIANRTSSQPNRSWRECFPPFPISTVPEINSDYVAQAIWKGNCPQDESSFQNALRDSLKTVWKHILPNLRTKRKFPVIKHLKRLITLKNSEPGM